MIASAAEPTVDQLADDDRELFGKLDVNGDALLTKTEIGAWPWIRFDGNQDGQVGIVEFLSGRADDRRKARLLPDDEEVWKLLDWTNDGWLSGTELDRGLWSSFDADGNGEVTKEEFLAGRAAAVPKAIDPPVKPEPSDAKSSTDGAPSSDWHVVLGDGVQFAMPSEPKRSSGPLDTRHGKLDATTYQLETDGGATSYLVFITDTKATPANLAAETPLNELVKAASAPGAAKLLDEKKISLGKFPGRELLLKDANALYRKRAYLANGRLIQLVIGTADASNASPAMIAKFLDSLEVLEAASPDAPDPGNLEAEVSAMLEAGDYQKAIDKLTALIAAQPEELLPRFLRGIVWLQKGEYQKSIDDNNELLKRHQVPAAYNNRGWAYFLLGQYDAAGRDFDSALRLDPSLIMSLKNRGWTHFARGDLKSAQADLEAALRTQPDFGWAHYNLALVYQAAGDYTRAVNEFEQALKLEPNYPSLYRMYAWMLATCPSAEHRSAKRALELAKHGCELTNLEDPDFVDVLAAAAAESGDFEIAVKAENQAIALLADKPTDEQKSRLAIYRAARPFRDRSQLAGNPWVVAAGAIDPRYPAEESPLAKTDPAVPTKPIFDAPQADTPVAKPTTATFVNAREGLNEKLSELFVKFSFDYPSDWRMTRVGTEADSGTYVDIERVIEIDNKPYIVDSLSVGYLKLTGPAMLAPFLLPDVTVDLATKLGSQMIDYQVISQGEVKLGGAPGYELRYQAKVDLGSKGQANLYGRLIVLSAADFGGNGVTLSLVETDAVSKISDASQIGETGELKGILDSFKVEKAD